MTFEEIRDSNHVAPQQFIRVGKEGRTLRGVDGGSARR
jgi:hypothetical protein